MTKRRMIEDYIPVEQISYESSREKVARRRQGHLSTLHLWWARRPLAACRGAVYAAFADPSSGKKREELAEFFTELCRWTGPVLPETEALKKARSVVEKAADGKRPRVLDMFAGGGAIPLEALRLGADAVALDLNPVAHLIQLCTLVYPQKYGKKLRDAVETWGNRVIDRTQEEIGDLYPDIPVDGDGGGAQLELGGKDAKGRALRPIAYLWTRTIPSPARGYEKGQVPLVRQTWLRKKKGNYVAARPIVDRENLTVRYEVVSSTAKTPEAAIKEWGFDPAGMSTRGSTTCPFSGTSVGVKEAKNAGLAGHIGHEPIAIVCVEPGRRGKQYLNFDGASDHMPSDRIIRNRLQKLCADHDLSVPDETVPIDNGRDFRTQLYGMNTYGDLFSPRQQLLLLTLCKNVREAHAALAAEGGDPDFAAAVASYLGLLVGRAADRGSMLCRWHNTGEKTENTYARQALPMVWDYSEPNPFGGASGDSRMQLNFILEVVDHAVAIADRPAEVIRGRAQKLPLPDESIDAVITDPPYYDNISYADLSDFFYVWHKRALGDILPAVYSTSITPKKAEAVVAPYRQDGDKKSSAAFYEEQMELSFREAHRVLEDDSLMVVVYAHKTTLGWSTLVDSLRRSGFQVTEAWPLDTEMPDRAGQMNTASLASSIFLVSRKRESGGVGSYATEVRPEMVKIVESRVSELMDAGISGADLVIAAVGAGLQPFTRYERVDLQSGEELPSEKFLDEVQREVLECILAAVFSLEREGVGQVDKASRFYVLGRYQYGGAQVDFGEMNVLAQGLGIELSGAGGVTVGNLKMVEGKKSKVRLLDYSERGMNPELGIGTEGSPAPLVDVLHRLLWLVENDRSKVPGFIDEAKVGSGRLRLLANALKGKALSGPGDEIRTDEQKAIDRLLAQWKRVVEAGALPLFEGE